MNYILSFFAIAPAWVVFSLFMAPFLLFMTFKSLITTPFFPETIGLCSWLAVLLWKYSIAVKLHEKYSRFLNVPINRFKACMAFNFIFSFILIYGIIPVEYLGPLSLVSFACNIYVIYFIAKLIVMVEYKRQVVFQEYLGTLIAVWVYVIGIWFLQPRIKNILLSNDS